MNPDISQLETGFGFGGLIERTLPEALRPHAMKAVSPLLGSDLYWMRESLLESFQGIGITNPNPAVGCVLVKGGRKIAIGATQAYRGMHAERVAFSILRETETLEGATAYVTLEPCSHQGNQPPCVDLLVESKIARVVIGRGDPDPRVNGQGIRKLLEAGKKVDMGFHAPEITAWNFPFFASKTLNRPIVALKWAQTLDGQLADDSDTSQWISGPAARAYTHWIRQRYDAILVGAGTALADFPRLSVRDCAPPIQSQPMRVILDPRGHCLSLTEPLRVRFEQTVLAPAYLGVPGPPIILLTSRTAWEGASRDWLKKLESFPRLRVIADDRLQGEERVPAALEHLGSAAVEELLGRPFQSLLVEGGPSTTAAFLRAGAGDLIHAFVAPKLTGGKRHRIEVGRLLKNAESYSLIAESRLGDDLLLEMVPESLASRLFLKKNG